MTAQNFMCYHLKALTCSLEITGPFFSFFLFPKYRIFQPSDSEFSKVMDNSRLSFALSSIAQLWYEVALPMQLQSRIQM